MNCRGKDVRKRIVDTYKVVCEAHIRLLNGQTIHSDAESEITREYYVFICYDKANGKIVDRIVCGSGAARHFFELTNTISPSVFNMLQEDYQGDAGEIKEGGDNTSAKGKKPQWDPAAKELYNAIMILIVAWNLRPGPIYKYLDEARKYKGCKPFLYRVERINRILERHDTTMKNIIDQLKRNNPNLKEYNFDALAEIMLDSEHESRF